MKLKSDWLPTSEVAALVKEQMRKYPNLSASLIDQRAGYVNKSGDASGVTRKLLQERTVSTKLDKAERILEAVNLSLQDVPTYAAVDIPVEKEPQKGSKSRRLRIRKPVGIRRPRTEHHHPTWTGLFPSTHPRQ